MKSLYLAIAFLFLVSCSKPVKQNAENPSIGPTPETFSFSGKPLYQKPTDSIAMAKADSIINTLKSKSPITEDDYIELGRQYVSTNRFNMAIEIFSVGLGNFPNSFKLLRHRGHRYLNLRQLDKAILDLNKAEELIRNQPEVWEYDAAGKPSATYQHQIWYHIGLYYFLRKSYAESATVYEKCLAATKEGKNIAGASDWLYNAYQRSGQKEKAAIVAKPFTLDFVIEDKDYPYFRRLLLFNGKIKPEELIDESKPIEQLSLTELTKLYGLANWYAYNGNKEKAKTLYSKILLSKEWAGFAYACAELDAE